MNKIYLVIAGLSAHNAFATTSETKEFESKSLTEVDIKNTSGKVTVVATDSPKATVVATKNKFLDNCNLVMEQKAGRLILKVEKTGILSFSNCDVDFALNVPKTLNLKLQTGSGNFKVKGIQGSLYFKIGSGNIDADGDFKEINGIMGSGDVFVKGLAGGGEIETGSGNIDLTYAEGFKKGELEISTGSGDATILFPIGSKVDSDFQAGTGKISNELGDTPHAPFVVSMQAGSGNLKIKSYDAAIKPAK